jgi:ATP-dependent DNA helicase PIF1
MPEKIEMTDELARALDLMENTNKHIFITGKAGTGKSTLLRYFRDTTKKNAVVLAPTGVAALNVEGATLHSFFQFGFGVLEEGEIKLLPKKADIFKHLDTVIIDEISMVRSDLMNAIDAALRINKRKKDLPFGGVQVIMFGDLYQLPPVVVGAEERAYLNERYGGIYFFAAPVFGEIDLAKVELTRNFRQEEETFIELLNKVRENRADRVDLELLNGRIREYEGGEPVITLAPTNAVTSALNAGKLKEIKGKETAYEAAVSGDFRERDFPTDRELRLKVGAQIMMMKNDGQKRWVNGSLGVVEKIRKEYLEVRIGDDSHMVERTVWEAYDYVFDRGEEKIEQVVRGSFTQFPVKLAWAVTIHKSQGQTFDRVIIDMGRGAWLHGQTYVALSRCTSLDGIYLRKRINSRDIVVDQAVERFHGFGRGN